MSRAIASIVLLVATLIGIQVLLLLNERWAGPSSQELIDQLVTTNPRSTGDWNEKRPTTWSDAEDGRDHRVIARLNANPRRHMDALITNVDRSEFATTMSTSVPFSPLTVGMICRDVAAFHFYRYCPRSAFEDDDRPKRTFRNYFDRMGEPLIVWWAENRGKSNQEIGRLIADWHRTERAEKPLK